MARVRKLDKIWYCRISSSISNWREKILKRYGLSEVNWPIYTNTLFFGLYHPFDYLRFIVCRGTRIVFWCGSDILALEKSYWKRIIARVTAEHICENYVEQQKLREMGIEARIQPICLSTPYPELSYKWSKDTHVYLTVREGREKEYGMELFCEAAKILPDITFHVYGGGIGREGAWITSYPDGCYRSYKDKTECAIRPSIPNMIFHGGLPEEVFNEHIKEFHACVRLNEFDGFGDALAKSVLMGQHSISMIKYPYITYAKDVLSLIEALKELKYKKEPNYQAAEYWGKELNKPLI